MQIIFADNFTVNIPFENIENFTPESILNALESFIQSNQKVRVNEFRAKISTVYQNLTVGHALQLKYKPELDSVNGILNVRSIPTYFYKPGEKGCLFLAIAYRLLKKECDHPSVSKIERKAKELASLCGINYRADIGINEIAIIERKIQIRVTVLKTEPKSSTVESFYIPRIKELDKPLIQLLLHKNCYYSFTSFRNILCDNVYGRFGGICIHCNEVVRDFSCHLTSCIRRCNACYFPESLCPTPISPIGDENNFTDNEKLNCKNCNRDFLSVECFNNHKRDLTEAMISNSVKKSQGKTNYNICGKV